MDESTKTKVNGGDLRDELAVERTFLAWIRTGVACMGFGFVVARFGLFLQQLLILRNIPAAHSYGFSLWLGTALIAAGVITNVIAAWHYSRLLGALRRGELPSARPSTQAVVLAIFLAIVGLAMAIYLISVQGLPHAASGSATSMVGGHPAPSSNAATSDQAVRQSGRG